MAQHSDKYLNQFKEELSNILEKHGYSIYSGKGKFKAGKCMVHNDNKIVLNKYAPLEHRVDFLVDMVTRLDLTKVYLKPATRKKVEKWKK